jgi:hypothetical protein
MSHSSVWSPFPINEATMLYFSRRFLVCATLCFLFLASSFASGPVTGTYKVLIIQTTYSDDTTRVSSAENLNLAAGEIHDYFNKLSFGALDVEVSIGLSTLSQPKSHYWSSCPSSDDSGKMCLDMNQLFVDAAESAGAAGASFANVKTVLVLSSCDVYGPYDNWTAGSDQDLNSTHAHASHVHRVVDTDCPDDPRYPVTEFPHLGPSGVNWNAWVHELGHTIQLEGHDMFSHPGGYSSGYDLMDSCYPCGESVYSLSGNPIVANENKTSFPGWLSSSKTVVIPRPTTGTAGGTYVLEPVNAPSPGSTVAPRGIKLPLGDDRSIFVEARTNTGSDNRSYGLFDQGVHIYTAEEGHNDDNGNPKPLTMLDACQFTVTGGCVYDRSDPRLSTCPDFVAHLSETHAYCWPFALWHTGDTFNDAVNQIMVHVNGKVGDGYGVTVTRNVSPGHPDVFIYPWLTSPMNTYETIDIWVDSSCNGYEDTVGPAGLRYHRRGDGTVIGNGDDPCANHENRIYAHVRNGGSAPAINAHVHFYVTDPLGVGIRGASGWVEVGNTTIPYLAAGAERDVYVNWTPSVTLTPAEISSGHFNFHSCVQIKIDAVAGEVVLSNQDGDGEQENFDHFEAVRDPITHDYVVPDRFFYVSNNYSKSHMNVTGAPMAPDSDFYKPTQLRVKSELPPDWTYQVNGGVYDFTLAPHEIKQIPVKVTVPSGTPVAQTFLLRATAFQQQHMINNAVSDANPYHWHFGWDTVAGVVEAVQTVDPSKITITAEWKCPDTSVALTHVPPASIHVKGKLEPAHDNVIIAIDYTPPSGPVQTHLVHTNAAGEFEDTLNSPAPGTWKIRAFWQGDMDHSSSVSDEQSVTPADCNKKPQNNTPIAQRPLPPGSTILLPPDSFPGGILTGVVIGPDDQPVPNTPVQIAGGVPTELTGVVVGEEPPKTAEKRDPCAPDANGKIPLGCEKKRETPPAQPCPQTAAGTPAANCPVATLPPVNVPQDCAGLLKQAQGILNQPGNQGIDHILIGLLQPSTTGGIIAPTDMRKAGGEQVREAANQPGAANQVREAANQPGLASGGNTYINAAGGGILTDANGRFALCVKPDAKNVDIIPGDGSAKTSVPATGQVPTGACDKPPAFFQANQKIDLCKPVSKPTMIQGNNTWLLPAVQAISPRGDKTIVTVKSPRDLQPGPVNFSFFDKSGQKQSFTGGVFKIVSASMDRSKLRSNEGADFDYEVEFSPQWGGQPLCVNVKTLGPIVLTQPPAAQLSVNGDGHSSIRGKIRATQVAPGSAVPFEIKLNVFDCATGQH